MKFVKILTVVEWPKQKFSIFFKNIWKRNCDILLSDLGEMQRLILADFPD